MEVFNIIAFRRHPSPFRGLSLGFLHPILYFQPSPSQSDSPHFHFNVSRFFIFTGSATVLSERFLPMGVFTLYSFVCDSGERAGTPHPGSSSVPALTELFLSADAWTWTIDVWITRPLIYQLCQWATKYRVKIEVLNVSLVQSQQNNYFWLAQSQPNNYFFVTCSKSAKWLIQNQTFILPLIQHQILTLLLNLNQILVQCLWV